MARTLKKKAVQAGSTWEADLDGSLWLVTRLEELPPNEHGKRHVAEAHGVDLDALTLAVMRDISDMTKEARVPTHILTSSGRCSVAGVGHDAAFAPFPS